VARAICLLLVVSVVAGASAQTQTPTPETTPALETTPGLAPPPAPTPAPAPSPRTSQRREPPQTTMLTVSLSGSDTDIGAKDDAALVPISGFHTDVDTLLNYKHKTGRATFEAIGRSVLSYAPSSIETLTTTYDQGQLAFSMIAGHNRFQATQMVNYSPYYQFGALPDATPSSLTETAQSHGDFANSKVSAVVSTTGVDFGRTISRRDTLSFSYNLRRTTFGGENLDLTYQGGGVVYLHRLSRSVALRTG